MMTVRGQADQNENPKTDDSAFFDVMRNLGIGQLENCTLLPGF